MRGKGGKEKEEGRDILEYCFEQQPSAHCEEDEQKAQSGKFSPLCTHWSAEPPGVHFSFPSPVYY